MVQGPTPDWDKVPIRWRGLYLDGVAPSGSITVRANVARWLDDDLVTPSLAVLILSTPLTFTIASNGTATFDLPATDDPDIIPSNFTYTITENLNRGGGNTYAIEVPLARKTAGIDLQRIAPVPVSPGTPVSLVTRQEFDALAATVAAGGGGGGGGTGAVLSVNGRTGAVILTKTDVGLNAVDNTRDIDKPLSTAELTALTGKAPAVHTHIATEITSGLFPVARLGSGTATVQTVLRGDSTWGPAVTDHGALTGLNPDDDHPQYLTATRGNVLYYSKAEVDAKIDAISNPQNPPGVIPVTIPFTIQGSPPSSLLPVSIPFTVTDT